MKPMHHRRNFWILVGVVLALAGPGRVTADTGARRPGPFVQTGSASGGQARDGQESAGQAPGGQAPDSLKQAREQIEELAREIAALQERMADVEEPVAGRYFRPEGAATVDSLLAEIRQEDHGLSDRVNNLLDWAGYFDFEYFNDDRSGSPGEFRQHRLSLKPSKEIGDFRFFGEVEFEYGAKFEGQGTVEGARGDSVIVNEARGEILTEQAWGEYVFPSWLTIRAGLILTRGTGM